MLERHSVFGYQCSTCKNVYPKSSARHSCCKGGLTIRGPDEDPVYEAYSQNCTVIVIPDKRRLAEKGEGKIKTFTELHHPGPALDAISPPLQEEDAISILAEVDVDFGSVYTESLYSPKHRAPARAPSVAYIPTPTQVLRVQQMKLAQDKRVILNVCGQKFETSVSILHHLTETVYTYFMDRDPSHFRHILNYLRNGGGDTTNALPHDLRYLKELQREADFFTVCDTLLLHVNIHLCIHFVMQQYDVFFPLT
ncbi:hypothetical protein ACJMK2_001318 [Sinanodonta woodiana]|uniref:Potassium channel tetramerisation-type BTB domain-containing protein n=1 Tax=Sinanodonta woodiana TaxID=1069815 RepID=A0ABD3XRW1_SINWO